MPQRIAEELQRNNPETSTPSQKLDDDNLTELISQAIDVALQSRFYDDEKYVDKIVGSFTEFANCQRVSMYDHSNAVAYP